MRIPVRNRHAVMSKALQPDIERSDESTKTRTARKKSPDPTHPHSVDGSDATASATLEKPPADPGESTDSDDLGRKVMSPETENSMRWYRQNQQEGIKMQVEKQRVHKGVHNVHTPLAGQAATSPLPYARETRKGDENSSGYVARGHVISTAPPHE